MSSQSVNRSAHQPGALNLRQLIQDCEPVKDTHHSSFTRFIEVVAGNGHGHIQLVTYSFLLASHFFTLLAQQFCRQFALFAIVVSRYVPAPLTAPAPHKDSISLLPLLINWPFGLITCVSRLLNPMTALCRVPAAGETLKFREIQP